MHELPGIAWSFLNSSFYLILLNDIIFFLVRLGLLYVYIELFF